MENKKVKWFVYTVGVGLIPVFCRLLVCMVSKSEDLQWLAASDLIAFGLVLHISNMNEIEHLSGDESWKTKQNGTSIFFITLYTVLFASILFGEATKDLIEINTVKICTIALAIVSLLISYSVFDRISKIPSHERLTK